jgi:hypothetical protein
VSRGTPRIKGRLLPFVLLAVAIPPAIDLLGGEVRPLRWLLAYLVFTAIGVVTYTAWRLWPDRLLLRIAVGVLGAVAVVAVVFVVALIGP